jgi:hypothetical protein
MKSPRSLIRDPSADGLSDRGKSSADALIPADIAAATSSDAISADGALCEHCGKAFSPRRRSGGKPQRFCSPKCRADYHSQHSPTLGQRGASHVGPETLADTGEPKKEAPTTAAPNGYVSVEYAAELVKAATGSHRDESPVNPHHSEDYRRPDFDWAKEKDSIVLSEQQRIAVYHNADDGLVIRQEARWPDSDDHYVIIAKENIEHFLDKLCDACGVASFP